MTFVTDVEVDRIEVQRDVAAAFEVVITNQFHPKNPELYNRRRVPSNSVSNNGYAVGTNVAWQKIHKQIIRRIRRMNNKCHYNTFPFDESESNSTRARALETSIRAVRKRLVNHIENNQKHMMVVKSAFEAELNKKNISIEASIIPDKTSRLKDGACWQECYDNVVDTLRGKDGVFKNLTKHHSERTASKFRTLNESYIRMANRLTRYSCR